MTWPSNTFVRDDDAEAGIEVTEGFELRFAEPEIIRHGRIVLPSVKHNLFKDGNSHCGMTAQWTLRPIG